MRTIRSVNWAVLGTIITGFIMIAALLLSDIFLFGAFVGFWCGGLYWTYWVHYHSPKEAGEE